jgi:hypothetical protein
LPFNAELEGLYVLGKIIAALLRNACVDRKRPAAAKRRIGPQELGILRDAAKRQLLWMRR